MNWARGLLRLWLVLAILWGASVLLVLETYSSAQAYLAGEHQRTDVAPAEIQASAPSNGVVIVTHGARTYKVDAGGTTPDMPADWERLLDAAAKYVNQQGAIANAQIAMAKHDVLFSIGVAAGFPLLILIIGASMFWAFRGFRRPQT